MKKGKFNMFTAERVSMLLLAVAVGLLLFFVAREKKSVGEMPPVPQSLIDSIRSQPRDTVIVKSDSAGAGRKKRGKTRKKSTAMKKPAGRQRSHLDEPADRPQQ